MFEGVKYYIPNFGRVYSKELESRPIEIGLTSNRQYKSLQEYNPNPSHLPLSSLRTSDRSGSDVDMAHPFLKKDDDLDEEG